MSRAPWSASTVRRYIVKCLILRFYLSKQAVPCGQSQMQSSRSFGTILISAGLLAPLFTVAETREEWMARSNEKAQARRLAAQERKQERLERATSLLARLL